MLGAGGGKAGTCASPVGVWSHHIGSYVAPHRQEEFFKLSIQVRGDSSLKEFQSPPSLALSLLPHAWLQSIKDAADEPPPFGGATDTGWWEGDVENHAFPSPGSEVKAVRGHG